MFIEPCRPSKAPRPPSSPQWIHEIKFDGFRLMVRKDGERVRYSEVPARADWLHEIKYDGYRYEPYGRDRIARQVTFEGRWGFIAGNYFAAMEDSFRAQLLSAGLLWQISVG
jgi:ATP-dependent DNA ligase